MSKSSLTLIAGSAKTKQALQEQLEQLLGDYVHIKSHSADEGLPESLEDTIILYSSDAAYDKTNDIYSHKCRENNCGKENGSS